MCSSETQEKCFHTRYAIALQKHYDKLEEAILGKNYYNLALDVFSNNEVALGDMLYEIRRMKRLISKLKIYITVNVIFCLVLLIAFSLK